MNGAMKVTSFSGSRQESDTMHEEQKDWREQSLPSSESKKQNESECEGYKEKLNMKERGGKNEWHKRPREAEDQTCTLLPDSSKHKEKESQGNE